MFRDGAPPEAHYSFKHALVQDTAYESLLRSRRQILHRRIAETLCEKFAGVVEAQPELVAHHFTQAGLTEPAIEYWGKAGDLALRRSAFKEAIAHLDKAIKMREAVASVGENGKDKTGGKLKLQVAYANATLGLHGYTAPETSAAFARARETAGPVEGSFDWLSITYGQWAGAYVRGELGPMRDLADLFLHNVAARPDLSEACIAHRIYGVTKWFTGDFDGAGTHLERALNLYDPERDRDLGLHFGQDIGIAAMVYLALVAWAKVELIARVSSSKISSRELLEFRTLARSLTGTCMPSCLR